MRKTFIVTGATSGIGLETARQLAGRGIFVIGVGRSAERCEAAELSIRTSHPGAQVLYLVADLSLQSQVRALARRVEEELKNHGVGALDGLVNDAATFSWRRRITAEGFELQWAVNHLAPFLLTHELLPLLQAAETARIVNVSSNSHYHARLNWNDLQMRHFYFGYRMYGQTKLCNVCFTAELRRRLGTGSRIRAFAAHPGLVHTELGMKGNRGLVYWFWKYWSRRGIAPEESAGRIVYVSTEPSIAYSPEVYWSRCMPAAPNPIGLDPQAGKRLWEVSEKMVGIED